MAKVRVRAKRHMQPSIGWSIGARDIVLNCSVEDFISWMRGDHLKPVADPRKEARHRRKSGE